MGVNPCRRPPLTRRKTESLRLLTDSERQALEQLSRSSRESAGQVARAKGLLAVTAGKTYTEAAVAAGRKTGDTVARWVSEFNRQGLAALERKHGGGPALKYGSTERERILTEVRRQPTPAEDGTANVVVAVRPPGEAVLMSPSKPFPHVSKGVSSPRCFSPLVTRIYTKTGHQ